MHKSDFLISVVIPTYNQAVWLDEALDGLIKQTNSNFNVIISNNVSTDKTDEIVKKYMNKLNIIYKKESVFLDKTSNWNRAMHYSESKYTLLHHSDDILKENTIEVLYKYIKKFPNIVLFHGSHSLISPSSKIIKTDSGLKFSYQYQAKHNLLNFICNISIVGVLFKTDNFLTVGAFDNKFQQLQDWDLYLKLIENESFMFIKETLGYWRVGKLSDSLHHLQNIETIKLLCSTKNHIFKSLNINKTINQHLKFYEKNKLFKDEYVEVLKSLNIEIRNSILSKPIINNYIKLLKLFLIIKFKVGLK